MDRYITKVGFWTLGNTQLDYLICSSCFIAAKLQEPHKPKLDDIKAQFMEITDSNITLRKELVVAMNRLILAKFDFDFNFCNPKHLIDRFMRILGYHLQPDIK